MSESLKIEPRSKLDSGKSNTNIISENTIELYDLRGSYYCVEKGIVERLNRVAALDRWERAEMKKSDFIRSATTIHRYSVKVDFTRKNTVYAELDIETREIVLHHIINPSQYWIRRSSYDKNIVNEYKEKVFEGKLDDLIDLVVLSLLSGEGKLNKLFLSGASNKGKTGIFKILEFMKVKSSEFKDMLKPVGTGWSEERYKELSKIGLLLVDDIGFTIGTEIKDIDECQFEVLVKRIGIQTVPINFLAMTSTGTHHIEATGEEINNRILHMDLNDNFVLSDSDYWHGSKSEYQSHTEAYTRNRVLDVLESGSNPKRLSELQHQYRIDSDNFLAEIIRSTLNEIYDDLEDEHLNHFNTVLIDENLLLNDLVKFKQRVKEIYTKNVKGVGLDYAKYLSDITNSLHGDRKKFGTKRGQKYPIISRWDNSMLKKFS